MTEEVKKPKRVFTIASPEQSIFLQKYGGRTERHVRVDDDGFYISLYHPDYPLREERVYLPESIWL